MNALSISKYSNPITFLAFLMILYVIGNALPYLLLVLLILFTVQQLFHLKHAKESFVKGFRIFYPVIILIVIELVALFCTLNPLHYKSLILIKNITFLTIFLFLFSSLIHNKNDFKLLIKQVGNFFIIFSILVSLAGLFKFFYYPFFASYYGFFRENYHIWGTTLVSDYNFFALFLLNGLIFGLYRFIHNHENLKHKTLFLILLQIIITAGFLSASRRMVICLLGLFIGCLILLIPLLFKKVFPKTLSCRYLLIFIGASFLNMSIIYSFLSYYPLISEKAEKKLLINSEHINCNISAISTRINSALYSKIITPHQTSGSGVSIPTEVSLTKSREKLWELGKKTYSEYNIPQKIFGKGFSFFHLFEKETERFHYPHHLVLSILLFSGIIGLIIYFSVLSWASFLYLFHFKELWVLFVLFVCNFTFGLFSYTDFFATSFYPFLIFLPFLYRYIYLNKIVQP